MKNIYIVLIFLTSFNLLSQVKVVKGKVTDKMDNPLPGASIVVQGTTIGASADFNGLYTIKAKKGDVLVASYLGYKNATIIVDDLNSYNFVLTEDASQLDEIVVTGYTKEKKSDISGAITVVKVDELSEEAGPNILTNLQGRVPGIQINSGGTPGGNDSQIIIRGLTTVNSGSSPLWVIDGVQTFSPSSLNPEEIESIQVLKDGASTALYGTSAANGVIVVTTKKGKSGTSQFNLKSESTINFLRDDIKLLNAQQWADVYYQARKNDGITGDFNVLIDNGSGYDIPTYLDPQNLIRSSDTNWVDAIISNSVSYNTDFNYRYGNEKLQVFTGFNYARDNGIQNHTYYERYNLRLNTSYKFWNDKITIGENFLYSNFNEVKANEFENAILQNPLIPVYTETGTYTFPTIQDKPNSVANLWANRKNIQYNQRFLGNVYGNIEILEGLNFNTKLNFDYNIYNFDTRPEPFVQMNDIPSTFQNIDVDAIENTSLRTVFTNLLSYEKAFNKHRFTALLGVEFTREDSDFLTERIRGVDITQYPSYIVRADSEQQTIINQIEYRKQSQFASLKYIFDDKYILSGSIRRDGSSRFGPEYKFGIFPSASLAWNVDKEQFLVDSEKISSFKLRASWGVNGNDLIGDYRYLSAFIDNTVGNVIEFADYDIDGDGEGTLNGIIQARQANPNIRWEETTQINFGLDLGFFNNKLTFSGDVFDKRTNDLILQPIALGINGESTPPLINAGEVSNKGYEFVLGYQDNIDNEFKYGVNFNFASYKNNVESLDTDNNFLLNNAISITRKGSPIASFYGLIADGIFRTPEEVAVHANQPGKALGTIRYRDLNNDGQITNDDRTIIGNPHPDFIYGVNLTASYKGFDFSAYFDGKHGHDLYNTQRTLGDFTYFSFNFSQNTLDAWSPSNANSNIPALSTNNSNNQLQPSSYFVEDGSYLRLKTITLGYSLPDKFSKRIGLDNVRFYFVGQNLFDITSFTGFDYEVSGLSAAGIGIAGYGIPHTKTITFGLTTRF